MVRAVLIERQTSDCDVKYRIALSIQWKFHVHMTLNLVSFNKTLGCLLKTPLSESLVKSHDNNCYRQAALICFYFEFHGDLANTNIIS